MTFWDVVRPTVWTVCECDSWDCPNNDVTYGPHVSVRRDTSVHWGTTDLVRTERKKDGGWHSVYVTTCRCGWRDLSINWTEHLDNSAPLVEVLS